MSTPFHRQRRQVFMQEAFFVSALAAANESVATYKHLQTRADFDANDQRRLAWGIADTKYQLLSLRYTAGEPLEPLRNELATVIEAYERYQKALADHEQRLPKLPRWAWATSGTMSAACN